MAAFVCVQRLYMVHSDVFTAGFMYLTTQNLIPALDIEDAVFSLKALHCEKKLAFLIVDGGNDDAIVAPRTAAGMA